MTKGAVKDAGVWPAGPRQGPEAGAEPGMMWEQEAEGAERRMMQGRGEVAPRSRREDSAMAISLWLLYVKRHVVSEKAPFRVPPAGEFLEVALQ